MNPFCFHIGVSSVTLLKKIAQKLGKPNSNPLTLAIESVFSNLIYRKNRPAFENVIQKRLSSALTQKFSEIYTNCVPFTFDGFSGIFEMKANLILNMLLSNSLDYTSVHNTSVEVRNRIESLFSCNAKDSWNCFTEDYRIVTERERSRILSIIKDSSIIKVDVGQIEEKFLNLFEQIDSNKNLKKFSELKQKFDELCRSEEVPSALQNRKIICEKTLNDGILAEKVWEGDISALKSALSFSNSNEKFTKVIDTKLNAENLREKHVDFFQKYDSVELNGDIFEITKLTDDAIKENFAAWKQTLKCNNENDIYTLKFVESTYCEIEAMRIFRFFRTTFISYQKANSGFRLA